MKFWQVDAFTDKPFSGNPAVVIVLSEDISDRLKQDIAMEMSVSETAFVLLSSNNIEIRWFTPNSEVSLCGHATLAAAHILWSQAIWDSNEITFQSKSGPLGVTKYRGGYTLDFPKQGPTERQDCEELVSEIIGMKPLYIGSNDEDFVAVIEDTNYLRVITPNLEKIKQLSERGFLLTARDSDKNYDYIYRGFFPKLDVPEDPVTGSANTLLAPYWSEQLDKSSLRAYQASKRGGELFLKVEGERVLISGAARTVIAGQLLLD